MDYIKIYEKLRIKDILNKQIKNYFEFKDLNISLEKINFYCKVGVKNTIITGYIVTIIALFLSCLINRTVESIEENLYKFQVLPVYSDDYILDIKAEGIISIKMIHILYVIKKQKLRREKKNGGTSNRRNYANSNG